MPAKTESLEQQYQRAYQQFAAFEKPLDKYIFLAMLQSRNETLFYKLINEHLTETLPIVYTPTVGEACKKVY